MDRRRPGSSVHAIPQALEWVACPPPGDLPDPRIDPAPLRSPALASRFFTTSHRVLLLNAIPGHAQIQGGRKLNSTPNEGGEDKVMLHVG